MSSYEFQLADYNRIILRQFRFIFIIVIITTMAGLIIGHNMPRYYKAKAVIQADFQLFFEGAQVDPGLLNNMEENLGSMVVDMNGYTVLLKTVQILGRVADTVSISSATQDQAVLSAIEAVREMITLNPNAASKQIEIVVTAKNPQEAAAVANALSVAYRDFVFQNKRNFFVRKEQSIIGNLERCRNELSTATQRMVDARTLRQGLYDEDFHKKQQKKVDGLEKKRMQITYLQSVISAQQVELLNIRERIQQSQQQKDSSSTRDTIDNLPDLSWIVELAYRDPGLRMLNRRLVEQRDRRTGYLHFYKPGHPMVIALNKQLLNTIDELLVAIDRSEKMLRQESVAVITRTDTITESLTRQPKDENVLEWMNRSYQLQEEMCESIEAELTDVQVMIKGLVPYVHIAAEAVKPHAPTGFTTKKSGILGMAAGILLGVLLSIFREMADRSFCTVEDVRRVLSGNQVLSVIPFLRLGKRSIRFSKDSPSVFRHHFRKLLPVLFGSNSAGDESFQMLAAQLCLQNTRKDCAVILVTSSINNEGKTLIAANLALALALQGNQTTLVEADFRRPAISSLFGLPNLPGLFHLLVEAKTLTACRLTVTDLMLGSFECKDLLKIHGINNFSIIPYGAFPPNPVELFDSAPMERLIEEMRVDCDYIIIDSPPVTNLSDSLVLARHCNGIVMVYRFDKAPRDLLQASIRNIETTGTPVLGLALNASHNRDSDIVS